MDCSQAVSILLSRSQELPPELVNIIINGTNGTFLNAISNATLQRALTDRIITHLECLAAEICARWTSSKNLASVTAAFGRAVIAVPFVAEHAEAYFTRHPFAEVLASTKDDEELQEVMLGVFRLLVFDNTAFAQYVRPSDVQQCLSHSSRPVRYLAVRILSLYLHAADAATEQTISEYLGQGAVYGLWEEKNIDYRFLSLWEERRYADVDRSLAAIRNSGPDNRATLQAPRVLEYEDLSPLTVSVAGVLLPRPKPASARTSFRNSVIPTSTTLRNLKLFAKALLTPGPILLSGLAGSGKTSLVTHVSERLNKLDTMVTLHLNEQSDAKLLIGMYTSGSKPGSFTWQPGVLTTAVREGRWVFIEDLDRAPNEIISTLLPLIERGQLLIPGRREVVPVARGFKIIATNRTSIGTNGEERQVGTHMLGSRFWKHVHFHTMSDLELMEVIEGTCPALHEHIPSLLKVYARLAVILRSPSFAAESKTGSIRPVTVRDLLKWCRRIAARLRSTTTFSSSQLDDIFLEALDCFAGSLPNGPPLFAIAEGIAEELHVDPQRRDHLVLDRDVPYENGVARKGGALRIGRARLHTKNRPTMTAKRPFAINGHTARLLERIAVAVDLKEPLLLVGETGTGKTTCIQHLADQAGRRLVPFNLSQQSESGDLLGGFKPVNVRSIVIPLKDEFDDLFEISFSRKQNQSYLDLLNKSFAKGQWKRVCKLWDGALGMVRDLNKAPASPRTTNGNAATEHPKKRQKTDRNESLHASPFDFPNDRWQSFAANVKVLEAQLSSRSDAFTFSFVEGNIVKAVRNGDWVLLDEINLASPDTLETLADLIGGGPGGAPSLMLTETGNVERIEAHPDFRLFAAMNPATDVGKKDLPAGIRSRFTELYVESPDRDVKSLLSIVDTYIGGAADRTVVSDVTNLYLKIQGLASSNMLVDGAGQKPHFSLRTLTRTLSYARELAPLCSLRRGLYEGFHMSFLTFLDKHSEKLLEPVIEQHLFSKNARAEMKKPLRKPENGKIHVKIEGYWLHQGSLAPEEQPSYIITPFVQRNMKNLIRAASTRRYPVLIQGPTSSGKTSMIEYLAKKSGNKFVRINNHEHTDLQEYMGTYISGSDGKLQFQEGILVKALREGHWVVLDELNLAPSDVLEALNRLLDDNRELLLPETQEVVRPHEDFMLFATQNPAGLYGGRKVLSRAFRNRFLELYFDDIPVGELNEILHKRTRIPESWSRRIVEVYKELSNLRQEDRLFEQKSFATLRDLFRWALRNADSVEQLAINGYMLLAERVRKQDERQAVKAVIEKIMSSRGPRIRIDDKALYSATGSPEISMFQSNQGSQHVVWTQAMRRLFVLVAHALCNNEPVLLVGETGCGKTTVCQMLADTFGKTLHILNAHQNTETGDLIGAQRPVRNKASFEQQLIQQLQSALAISKPSTVFPDDVQVLMQDYVHLSPEEKASVPDQISQAIEVLQAKLASLFEWSDGSLVNAMKNGQYFLLDEISLADDSVLERLNSVLESHRTLLLAEKGPVDSFVVARDGFQFLATMNPGGDFGKRELSPALRNRFTEIWVPSLSDVDDIAQIVTAKLKHPASQYAESIVTFSQWFNQRYSGSSTSSVSVRDTLAWVEFVNKCTSLETMDAILQGAAMVFIDTLGANPAALLAITTDKIQEERHQCLLKLSELLDYDLVPRYHQALQIRETDSIMCIGTFEVPKAGASGLGATFTFAAPTTLMNAMRVFRALQLNKPILLEGSPGVGKTSLVVALANSVSKPLARINLSEQTDLMDLFGSDVPAEGAKAGTFAWKDAPFLTAMKNGDWVLLDEMNLASQSVLEGLNACLDHRGEVYISELDQTFKRHSDFRVFAAQNPHHQGGGRKGLPVSFVNRFTVVYADVFSPLDLLIICRQALPNVDEALVAKLIRFVAELDANVVQQRRFGANGGPWEFNLRDTLRWLQLSTSKQGLLPAATSQDLLDIIFTQRFRTSSDRSSVQRLFSHTFGESIQPRNRSSSLSRQAVQVGLGLLPRDHLTRTLNAQASSTKEHFAAAETMMVCIQQGWPVVLVGPSGCGKTALIESMAAATGAKLTTFPMNADIDAMDLVGGYEQLDPGRKVEYFVSRFRNFLQIQLVKALTNGGSANFTILFHLLQLISSHFMKQKLVAVHEQLQKLQIEGAEGFLLECNDLLQAPEDVQGARFEWVDGMLVHALENGEWLVLDNANLCSSSVLDRLNSLLEPNGYLSINEHSMENGEARVVKPHQGFRIFLTMDPHYGELSRAMRNRAVEVFMMPSTPDMATEMLRRYAFDFELSMSGFRNFMHPDLLSSMSVSSSLVTEISWDHLVYRNCSLFHQFQEQVATGLLGYDVSAVTILLKVLEGCNTIVQSLCESSQLSIGSSIFDIRPLLSGQSIHPLNNELLVRYNANVSAQSHWWAALHETAVELCKMEAALSNATSIAGPVSSMNRLQRSLSAGRIPSLAKDSTAKVAQFLNQCIKSIKSWIVERIASRDKPMHVGTALKNLTLFWWNLFRLVNAPDFEEATFQSFLDIGRQQLSGSAAWPTQLAGLFAGLRTALQVFASSNKLSTGICMERIWADLRPQVPRSYNDLQSVLSLESIAARFDQVTFGANAPMTELVRIRNALHDATDLAMKQSVDLVELTASFSGAIAGLENQGPEAKAALSPHFRTDFDMLCQYLILNCDRASPVAEEDSLLAQSAILAQRQTQMPLGKPNGSSGHRALSLIKHLTASDKIRLDSSATVSLLRNTTDVGSVELKQLDLLQSEVDVLGRVLSTHSSVLTQSPFLVLDAVLKALSDQITELCTHDAAELEMMQFYTIKRNHLDSVYDYLQASFSNDQDKTRKAADAWTHFGLAATLLYVPDRQCDPALRPKVERDLFAARSAELQEQMRALEHFNTCITGQPTSLRSRLLKEELSEMGTEPEVPAIARPPVSDLARLQGDFQSLLSICRGVERLMASNPDTVFHDATIQQNLRQTIDRLSNNYRAYDDITGVAVGFLRCLQMAFSLSANAASQPDANTVAVLSRLHSTTPILSDAAVHPLLEQVMQDLQLTHTDVSLQMHALDVIAMVRSVHVSYTPSLEIRNQIYATFDHLFQAWKVKLSMDQQESQKKSSLYTYRGGDDESDAIDAEELDALFPDYENGSRSPEIDSSNMSRKDLAVRISDVHAQVMSPTDDSVNNVRSVLANATDMLTSLSGKSLPCDSWVGFGATLPLTFSALNTASQLVNSSSVNSRAYNFYTDPHIPEVRNLVLLVGRVQSRFHHIHTVWPEHAVPAEALRVCDELIAFRIHDPVAKIITKTEKLHETIHEWQKVASKEFSAATLYDEVTNLLISWRQLELTTWARLLDIETDKCIEDAKSWWFIAYENIIAAPESLLSGGQDLNLHVRELLATLESFFASTTLGQYHQRLQLLIQFKQHIELRAIDEPKFTALGTALGNFIIFYSRFEQPISEALQSGRQKLERNVKEVLLLASWKDRTIDALRQSAKTSHRKLFKLVRKFRKLLNQPVEPIIRQGLPEKSVVDTLFGPLHVVDASVDSEAYQHCDVSLPSWSARPTRFKNAEATLVVMKKMSATPLNAVDGISYISTFLSDVESSIAQLQKATPSTLTEENKETVKHLKARKRKLFADILKDVRQMGFRASLGGDTLAKQDSLATVLAVVPKLPNGSATPLDGSAYYFDKLLDLMPQVRERSREHHDDLTSAEVSRSVGYLESLLQTSISQRHTVAHGFYELHSLQRSIELAAALWPARVVKADSEVNLNLGSQAAILAWLPPLISIVAEIVGSQAQLGKFDAATVTNGLNGWAMKLQKLQQVSLPMLPEGVHSVAHVAHVDLIKQELDGFRMALTQWTEQFPMLKQVLQRLLPWIDGVPKRTLETVNGHRDLSVDRVADLVFSLLDSILGAIQDLEKSLSTIPSSTDDAAWYTAEGKALAQSVRALHTAHIYKSLQTLLDGMRYMDSAGLRTVAAVFASVMPIIEQYYKICQHHVTKVAVFHEATCKLGYRLAKSFVQIGKQGFCTPPEKSNEKADTDDKLEGGTGLGEGEGAEDISKDIGEDEDLSELAQEPSSKKDKEEIEDEKDAVDMADEEMEGEMGDAEDQEDGEESNASDKGDEEMDEEVGDVDDLGPSTVDEKMWDDPESAEKDKEGDAGKGKKNEDQMAAQDEQQAAEEQQEEEDAEAGAEESEDVQKQDMEHTDANLQQGENLDLPEDMDMDGQKSDESDSESLDGLEEDEAGQEDGNVEDKPTEAAEDDTEMGQGEGEDEISETDMPADLDEPRDLEEEEEGGGEECGEVETNDAGDEAPDEQPDDNDGLLSAQDDQANSADDAAESQAQGVGTNEQQQEEQSSSENKAKQDQGTAGKEAENEQGVAGEEGTQGQVSQRDAVARADEQQATPQNEAFKKLGDALERWYNQQRQIHQPAKRDDAETQQQLQPDVDMADADFEHLNDDETSADAQALGTATEEQAKALDDKQAVATNEQERENDEFFDEADELQDKDQDVEMQDDETQAGQPHPESDITSKAFVGEQPNLPMRDRPQANDQDAVEESEVQDLETQLSPTQPERHSPSTLTIETARELWSHHESSTRHLSLLLTEQLRLILTPTLATKMRGDFRTGKRLNIKRIIPYIASQYKRDKIWMRRSVPSKRQYQIMLAVDDSKSMAEGSAQEMALQTLVLVGRSLSMLEVGEVSVVGFGSEVKMLHPFDRPFSSEAGVEVFQGFTFAQAKTDVKKLVTESIDMLREARLKASGSGAELWQLQLIISDGICEDHEAITRLVRQAQEERIMIVFVIVDAVNTGSASSSSAESKGESITDLQTAKFGPDENGEMKLVRGKYLDTFPFRWWIVVRDVRELPGVLATALRQWFSEVVDTGAY
ncbi:hypothetical protein LTS18_004293 [Coniosporium uncinatum]|uniref:Uncharacterized protein n=1 Tax=Coniosporium uncinatum TaxID=93489 RepID=A0ACC3E0C9_9PEZI|nr:hypothetical protein LTS18_004293 [Coniosporium uncinatum]